MLPADAFDLQLTSTAFSEGAVIPDEYTFRGAGAVPPLSIAEVPVEAQTLALIMHDPDAPNGDFTHWTIWNMPTDTESLDANSLPPSAVQGLSDFGQTGWGAPHPHAGTHHYMFQLYALNTTLDLPASATRAQLEQAMQGHILAETTLTGLVSA